MVIYYVELATQRATVALKQHYRFIRGAIGGVDSYTALSRAAAAAPVSVDICDKLPLSVERERP